MAGLRVSHGEVDEKAVGEETVSKSARKGRIVNNCFRFAA
jgi:hypothetical protein